MQNIKSSRNKMLKNLIKPWTVQNFLIRLSSILNNHLVSIILFSFFTWRKRMRMF
jgi:hypothetical protein